jgi:hypothetical protein
LCAWLSRPSGLRPLHSHSRAPHSSGGSRLALCALALSSLPIFQLPPCHVCKDPDLQFEVTDYVPLCSLNDSVLGECLSTRIAECMSLRVIRLFRQLGDRASLEILQLRQYAPALQHSPPRGAYNKASTHSIHNCFCAGFCIIRCVLSRTDQPSPWNAFNLAKTNVNIIGSIACLRT